MVILQTDDLESWRPHLEKIGVRIAWQGGIESPEHGFSWAGLHLHPRDTGGMMISFDRPDPPDSWAGAGAHWRDFVVQDVVDDLVSIEVRSSDPDQMADRWAATLVCPVSANRHLELDRGGISFAVASDDEPEGLATVTLNATDRSRAGQSMILGGMEFLLV